MRLILFLLLALIAVPAVSAYAFNEGDVLRVSSKSKATFTIYGDDYPRHVVVDGSKSVFVNEASLVKKTKKNYLKFIFIEQ